MINLLQVDKILSTAFNLNKMYISRSEFHGVQYISKTKNLTFTSSDVNNNDNKKMLGDYDDIKGEATVYSVKNLGT
ncbi:hypothetical protein GCM10008933_43780 [Paenibacillus motobuensis]|uniref:Uncharacterized protein n=1 Tax=Paenibacillus motobuensis TaxID=295324 RepID=A0ABN0YSQ7_9BACL